MTLLVVGATGTLGRQVTRLALDEGYQVRCLVRSYKKAAFLKEWGAELIGGDLCLADTLPPALQDVTAVIDASTARPNDSLSIQQVDWEGKVALIQAAKAAGVERFIFFSMLDAERYPDVPLMQVKHCTERFLAEAGLNYTVLRLCGFMQGLIGQYAIPILENQSVWVTGKSSPVAYMNTQDIARFAIRALSVEATQQQTFPVVGPRAWSAEEIVQLCERLSDKEAKITRIPLAWLRVVRQVARFFQWSWNIADRLAFAEVWATGQPLTAPMEDVYAVFGLDPQETTTLDAYMEEYFNRILRKLKELDYERDRIKDKSKSKKKLFR